MADADEPGEAPLVSVVMPAYNAAPYIAEALRSVSAQRYANWEMVIVDDGSTDDTVAVIESAGLPPERVRLIRLEHAGTGAARNRAIEQSRGELIAFLDADDCWEPAMLSTQVAAALSGPYDVAYCNCYMLGDERRQRYAIPVGSFSGPQMFRLLYRYNRFPVPTVVARRAALLEVGAFQEYGRTSRQSEDYDLWLRMADAGCSFVGVPDQLVAVRVHPGSHIFRPLSVHEADLEVIDRYAASMRALDEAGYRDRNKMLINEVAALRAASGDIAGARAALRRLCDFESGAEVMAKRWCLMLLRRRYAALRQALTRGTGGDREPPPNGELMLGQMPQSFKGGRP